MQKSTLAKIVGTFLTMGACATALAQTYSNAVVGLNPAGYWPLNETAQPPQVINLTATNSGSAGAAGNGYYGAWYQQSGNQWYLTNNIVTEVGPIAGADVAMNCQNATPGQYIILPRNTNGVANAAVTIKEPFSVEAWVNCGNLSGYRSIISEGGETAMNTGGPNPTNQFYGGPGLGWDGFTLGVYNNEFIFDCYVTNGESKGNELDGPTSLQVGQWVHVVCTYSGNQEILYTNGVQAKLKTTTANAAGQTYVVDPTSPLIIGAGPGVPVSYGTGWYGGLAEVAVYPTALSSSQVLNHYQAASSGVSTYTNTVMGDSPILYFRLNDGEMQTNAGYPSASFPVATNFGTLGVAANGVYQPGTTPGMAGPPYSGFGANSKSVAINGWLGAVDVGGSNLPSELNPTGAAPLTVVSWFQTGPADSPGRVQDLVGHSDLSYRLGLGTNTFTGENNFNPGPGPQLQASSAAQVITNGFAFNDGNWHMAAGVSDGTNEYLYLDGSLALSNNNPAGIKIIGTNTDLLLGGDPEYTYAVWAPSVNQNPADTIRNFDGNIAHVAYWTNALSAAQIQLLFNAAGVPPYIGSQPVSSVIANQGQNVTVTTGIRGSSLTYQWYTTNGVAVSGQTGSSLVFNPAVAANSGAYYVVATGASGSVTSSIVNVTIYGAPAIMGQTPAQLEIFSNSTPTLYVVASGASLHYQWTISGTAIPGATNSIYTVADITTNVTYGCTLTNIAGTNYITPISITALADPTAPYPAQVLANHPIAYYRLDEQPNATTAYDYVGGFNGGYTNALTGYPGYTSPSGSPSGSDPSETCALFGYDNPPNNYVGDVTPFPNFGTPTGSNGEFTVEAWINETYFNSTVDGDCIVGLGTGGGGEQFVLDDGASTSGDLRFFVRNAAGTTSVASSGTTVAADGLWHHVVGVCDEAGGHIYLYLDGNQIASQAITAGSGILASTVPLSIGARQGSNSNPPNYNYQFYGYIDDVSIYNKALSAAQVQADYLASGTPPANVQVQPSNLATNQGANATFTATAQGGTPPFSYQWDYNNNPMSGQTNSTLVLTDVQPGQDGTYSVTVANSYGSMSAQATLQVSSGAATLVQDIEPAGVTNYALTPITLSIIAGGTLPIDYQWYQDGTALAGATNSSYSFNMLAGTNTYYCVFSNSFNSSPVTSSTATVVAVPVSVANPANFNSRLKITFTGYTNSETLQDFPALVRLSPDLPGFNYAEFAGANGSDLRFADSSGTRELPYEVVQWDDTNGVSTIWVQVPTLSGGTNNYIWAYWGNPNDTTIPAYTTNGSVWEPAAFLDLPGYDVVYHLQQTNFPYLDSTTNYPGTNDNGAAGAPTPVPGIVGNGAFFNGGSDYIDAGDVNLGNQFTVSAWVNESTNADQILGVWVNGVGGYDSDEMAFFINDYNTSDGALLFGAGNGTAGTQPETATGLVTAGQWHLVTATANRATGAIQFYVDGLARPLNTADGTSIRTDFPTNSDMNLGRFVGGFAPFYGTMDEARIHGGIDDSNWVWADYQTVENNSTFSSYSSVTNTIVLPITLKIRVSGDQAILTWPAGTLQSSGNLNGPYSNVTGVTSPYTNTISGTQQYYRVQAQY